MLIKVYHKAFETVPVSFIANLPNPPEDLSLLKVLEHVFRQLNRVDGTEWIAGKPYRSLSVGDEVRLGLFKYRVDALGWSVWDVNAQEWRALQ